MPTSSGWSSRGVRPVEQLTPEDAREQAERSATVLFGPVERVASVSEFDTDGVRVRALQLALAQA